ncbi:holo-[acyl-carrier-protein] synthase [Paenibacillus rhizovicinus]|uniref:Holo-[acyl-carrier-protein] synthase n=1 Tax=Paenibacillus rhizovicinus TaxID=2704463 RepID=A0A6C0NXP9_9BACL|nr:holo-ACP synthase [Paenibacillus rhizovicinus]QHW30979.1 holo-[acyl-carrier-protein] synthase [Paenibacillus rhizovicinus]
MIIGIGHDLASLERIEKALRGSAGARFQERILTERERDMAAAYSGRRFVEFVGGRFAVKEAVSKAFGCGIGGTLGFQDIEIGRESSGKPLCRLSAEAWNRLGMHEPDVAVHVSISHDHALASAYVIVERMN